jgi:2-polyprenyl-3-methyl-5-hydroxy-6-metoxy-1,4-benzoquinol methylase
MQEIRSYFTTTASNQAEIDWRMNCYQAGQRYADHIKANHFDLTDKRVLDLACGWGGHALAFAENGATVSASDLNDFAFDKLRAYCAANGIPIEVQTGDCQALPWEGKYDVILALDLIEHIPSPESLASEITRLLAPGGVCILTTPAKLLSVFWGEPHWQMKGLSLLPFKLQRPVAQIIGKKYPFPIERQYSHISQLEKVFKGLRCKPVAGSQKLPLPSVAWGFIEIQ